MPGVPKQLWWSSEVRATPAPGGKPIGAVFVRARCEESVACGRRWVRRESSTLAGLDTRDSGSDRCSAGIRSGHLDIFMLGDVHWDLFLHIGSRSAYRQRGLNRGPDPCRASRDRVAFHRCSNPPLDACGGRFPNGRCPSRCSDDRSLLHSNGWARMGCSACLEPALPRPGAVLISGPITGTPPTRRAAYRRFWRVPVDMFCSPAGDYQIADSGAAVDRRQRRSQRVRAKPTDRQLCDARATWATRSSWARQRGGGYRHLGQVLVARRCLDFSNVRSEAAAEGRTGARSFPDGPSGTPAATAPGDL